MSCPFSCFGLLRPRHCSTDKWRRTPRGSRVELPRNFGVWTLLHKQKHDSKRSNFWVHRNRWSDPKSENPLVRILFGANRVHCLRRSAVLILISRQLLGTASLIDSSFPLFHSFDRTHNRTFTHSMSLFDSFVLFLPSFLDVCPRFGIDYL